MAGTRDDPEQAPADLGHRIAEIYGGPFAEFVPRREALARELRGSGRRDEATEVKALRKPKALAWALDAGALADPDATAELAAAVDAVSDAQSGDGDVRAAIARLRAAEEAVVAAAHDVARAHDNPVDRTAVASALRAVVGSPASLAALLAGRLVDPVAAGDGDGDAIDEAAWSAPPAKRRARRRSAGTATAGDGAPAGTDDAAGEVAAPPRADPAAVRAARRAVTAADRAATKAERAAEQAAAAAEEAEAAHAAAEREAAAARRRADELADAAGRARDDAAARANERDEAAAELARARADLDALAPQDD